MEVPAEKNDDDRGQQLEHNLDDEVLQEILGSGLDLRRYCKQVEGELLQAENNSIQDYIKESQNIASLHNQISTCDGILERMESILQGFQTHLSSINSEMMELQKRSTQMSQQLGNRQAVRATLSQFVDDITVSEDLINSIVDAPVTHEDFSTALKELGHKMSFVKEQSYRDSRSVLDVKEPLEHLRVKAVTKVRVFLLEQVFKLRKSMANFQVPQDNLLSKYKIFYEFLLANERSAAQEVCVEYVETMGKVYYSYFKAYISRLMKLQFDENPTKEDLMGVAENAAGRGLFHTRSNLKNRGAVFSLGTRGEVLAAGLKAPIIVPHAATKAEFKFPYETIFRSLQFALLENGCREFIFIKEFFIVQGNSALEMFNQVLGMTLGMLQKNLENYVADSYDAIGLMLCANICLKYKQICEERSIAALDQHWSVMQAAIWPRFEYVLKLHIQSVKQIDTAKFNRELRPHYITRRFAEFSAAIEFMNDAQPNEAVTRLVSQLSEEVECLLLRIAAAFPQRKEQLVFLINNLDLILSVHAEHAREAAGKDAAAREEPRREIIGFQEHLSQRSAEYVEEVLRPHFGACMQFVKEGEALTAKGQGDNLRQQETKCMDMAHKFSVCWRGALEKLSQEVLSSFPSLLTGSHLLQLTLSTLVTYHQRLYALLPPAAQATLANKHQLMVEIKKYKTTF
ncbi:vacuolar protein sorting-associated protein 52 homolog [Neocloeon triangulifer]|uniref:vacuolar protein sorting-associated protein 52 homolog n=1 Tax=Neocloeon triangulifer TaxID=2078957 RepID=UPI00286F3AE2|nr:vacuolar protein sorting-associated protein 52 homolog [Neocloeon triangulifer]